MNNNAVEKFMLQMKWSIYEKTLFMISSRIDLINFKEAHVRHTTKSKDLL